MVFPRPFPPSSPYASLLVETWKSAAVTKGHSAVNGTTTTHCDEAIALNSYSILHDRRIPQKLAKRLDEHYQTTWPAGCSYPETVMRSFVGLPSQDPTNVRNHLHGFKGRPLPKINLLSTVRLSKRLLEGVVAVRDTDLGYKNTAAAQGWENMISSLKDAVTSPDWAWLVEKSGSVSLLPHPVSPLDFAAKIRLLIEIINKVRTAPKFNPTQWSAGFIELEEHRKCLGHLSQPELAESWIAPLGMSYTPGEVFLIFKFPAAEAGYLCRPTHLDAGFYREHFPSPLDDAATWMAHPMFLVESDACPDLPLIAEYVHPQVRFQVGHLHAIAITQSGSRMDRIPKQRELHWPRLDQRYPACNLPERLFPAHTGIQRCDFAVCGCPAGHCGRILS